MGWTTIVHPFHPFRGRKFRVLKTRKVAGQDTLILEGSYRGTFALPIDWTGQAAPGPPDLADMVPRFLSIHHLLELADIIDHMGKEGLDT